MKLLQNKIVQIIIAMVITFGTVAILGIGSQSNMYPWFNQINKPSWNPPGWIFGPVWTFLYISMAYASFRVWDASNEDEARWPLILFIIQLILNGAWTQVFFNLHLIGAATIHILILLVLVIITGVMFFEVDRVAGILFIPYTAWLTFASILCFTIWRLNS